MVPFLILNYGCPMMNVPLKDFVVGNNGMIVIVIFYMYIGSTLSDFKDYIDGNFEFWERAPAYAIAAVCLFIAIFCMIRYARKELRLMVANNEGRVKKNTTRLN